MELSRQDPSSSIRPYCVRPGREAGESREKQRPAAKDERMGQACRRACHEEPFRGPVDVESQSCDAEAGTEGRKPPARGGPRRAGTGRRPGMQTR